MKADRVGVFVPSVGESCLDRQFSIDISELAASTSHYPHAVINASASMSHLGLLSVLASAFFVTSTKAEQFS